MIPCFPYVSSHTHGFWYTDKDYSCIILSNFYHSIHTLFSINFPCLSPMSFQYPLPRQIFNFFHSHSESLYFSVQQCCEVVILDVHSTHSHTGTSASRNSMSMSSIESMSHSAKGKNA